MLFSVIVPIYNVEKYLEECIESVLSQSYSDFELILVDDGSPDNSGKICDEYSQRDGRIKVVHKENGGLVSARKAGAEKALGDYVLHLDGDDKFDIHVLRNAKRIIDKNSPDIIVFAISAWNGDKTEQRHEIVPEGCYDKASMEREIYPKMLLSENMEHTFYYLCGKVIKREIAVSNQLKMDNRIAQGEDITCLSGIYFDCDSVYISYENAYFYRERTDSMSRRFRFPHFDQLVYSVEYMKNLGKGGYCGFDSQIDRYTLFVCFYLLQDASVDKRKDLLGDIKQKINHPVIWKHIQNAEFKNITVKTRMTYYLIKKNNIKGAYAVLSLCNKLKRR